MFRVGTTTATPACGIRFSPLWGALCTTMVASIFPVVCANPAYARDVDNDYSATQAPIARAVRFAGGWRDGVRRLVESGSIAPDRITPFLESLLAKATRPSPREEVIQIRACLYALRLRPAGNSLDVLYRIAESKTLPDETRAEAVLTLAKQPGALKEAQRFISSETDAVRAAALSALSQAYEIEEVEQLLKSKRADGVDYTGTHTGAVLAQIETMLDHSRVLQGVGPEEQIVYLLGRLPYAYPPAPCLPYIAEDPESQFVWRHIRLLASEHPGMVRSAINERRVQHPHVAGLLARLVEDLGLQVATDNEKKVSTAEGDSGTRATVATSTAAKAPQPVVATASTNENVGPPPSRTVSGGNNDGVTKTVGAPLPPPNPRMPWTILGIGLAAGLAVGAAGVWLLLRRQRSS